MCNSTFKRAGSAALLAVAAWVLNFGAAVEAAKPAANNGGTIYFYHNGGLTPGLGFAMMDADGRNKAPVQATPGEPSQYLHAARRLFLNTDTYEDGDGIVHSRIRASGRVIADLPNVLIPGVRWGLDDSAIAFLSVPDSESAPPAGFYAALLLYDETGDLYAVDTGSIVGLLPLPAEAAIGGWDWSSDGTRIAYRDDDQQHTGVFVADLLASQEILITENGGEPRWSPDGTRIAFSDLDGAEYVIVTTAVDGSNRTTVVRNRGNVPTDYLTPFWSPTGDRLVCREIRYQTGIEINIVRVNATGGGIKNLTGDLNGLSFFLYGWR